jgi:hypothetical protein
LGFPTTRKRSLENVLVVMQNAPTSTANKNATVGRAENEFFDSIKFNIMVFIKS